MKEAFSFIYQHNAWGYGSGLGSLPETTLEYRYFLEKFIAKHEIRSIVDIGCGDWQFSRYIYWWGASYTGYDVVPSLIEMNNTRFSSENIKFLQIPDNLDELLAADLYIVKDVLQHWPQKNITEFLHSIRDKYKFALITNSITPADNLNKDIRSGEYRALDLRLAPFNISAEQVFIYTLSCTLPNGKLETFTKNLLLLSNI